MARRAAAGDKDAFTALVNLYRQPLYATAMAVTRNEQDAMDAVQDTLLTMWEKLDTLRDPRAFKTWMTRILVNYCRGGLRQRSREMPLEYLEDAAEEQEDREAVLDVRRVLDRMSEEDRLILQLFYFEDFSTKEIAQALGLTPEAVRMRLTRSRKKFREKYGKEARHEEL